MKKNALLGMLALVSIFILNPLSTQGADLYVSPNGAESAMCTSDDPCALQTALTIAGANGEGDTIHLASGTYLPLAVTFAYLPSGMENFPLTLLGEGPALTVLDGTMDGNGDYSRILQISTQYLSNDDHSHIAIHGIGFQNRISLASGAGLFVFTDKGNVDVENCEFKENCASGPMHPSGGGSNIHTSWGRVTIRTCRFLNNGCDTDGGGLYVDSSGPLTLAANTFTGNTALKGGGFSAQGTFSGAIAGNTIKNNTASFDGGGFRFSSLGAVEITKNVIQNNTSLYAYGGGFRVQAHSVTITNNIVADNVASLYSGTAGGGGITVDLYDGVSFNLTNNTIAGNKAGFGGGLLVSVGGYENNSLTNINNNILWGNSSSPNNGFPVSHDLCIMNPSEVSFTTVALMNNDYAPGDDCVYIQEGNALSSAGNIQVDPQFVGSGDFHLQPGSPCIDMGNGSAPGLPDEDFDGDPRWVGSAPDIGADEFAVNTPTGDGVPVHPIVLVPDQVCDPDTSLSISCVGLPSGSLFQGFTPAVPSLAGVDLVLRPGMAFPREGFSTTILIRAGTIDGAILGEATTFVPGFPAPAPQENIRAHFVFFPFLMLTPGATYVIEWEDAGKQVNGTGILSWMLSQEDLYPGATAFGCSGQAVPARDFAFTTYSPSSAPAPVTTTFDHVAQAGSTTLVISDITEEPPMGFNLGDPPTYYDINTTAAYTGQITVCIDYSGISFMDERELMLFHYENGEWRDVTISLDTEQNIICGVVDSLSPFAVLEPAMLIDIDIKPGSSPNSINLNSNGVTPVAVLTAGGFDASLIDPGSVLLAGASPIRWKMGDVDADGDVDLLFHFNTQDLVLDESSTETTLTATTYDGKFVQGTDTVNIVPKSKKEQKGKR